MKKLSTLIIAFTFITTTLIAQQKSINTENSKVVWKGYKVTGSHEGTIAIKSGTLSFENELLTAGDFIIDMPTLTSTDLSGGGKDKLNNHLKSDDFFGVETHPTASLKFTNIKSSGKNSYEVTGDLTIKGKTNPTTFTLSIYGNKANASLKIDRTKFGVEYRSSNFFDNLKDKAIYDEFDLVADLQF
tara:strand:+ start:826712 stop:827272 length:561 start_codon:yes stop_codon:yes gene_type:complete